MLGNVIIEIYRAAQEMAMGEFQRFAFGLFRSVVPFDSARHAGGVLTSQGFTTHDFFLDNKSIESIIDYGQIAHIDPIVGELKTNPGRMIRFHPPSMYAERNKRPLLDFATRHEHMNGMSGLYVDPFTSKVQAVSIFRAHADQHFQEYESWLMEQIAPHFIEATKINRALSLQHTEQNIDQSAIAISGPSGALQFCSSGFRRIVNIDWPNWDAAILPQPLMNEIIRCIPCGMYSSGIRISIKQIGDLLFLRASENSTTLARSRVIPEKLQQNFGLTKAETRVAIAMLDGSSAKEVALCLNISPHTVRTQIKSIYRKLGVDTRTNLVMVILGAAQPFRD